MTAEPEWGIRIEKPGCNPVDTRLVSRLVAERWQRDTSSSVAARLRGEKATVITRAASGDPWTVYGRVTVTFDITDPDARHALTQALENYVRMQEEVLDILGDNQEKRRSWAAHAKAMHGQAEAAGR